MDLVCASANSHKYSEIAQILSGVVNLIPRPPEIPDVVEDANTLEGNARLKATAIRSSTGSPAVADDTGLEVDALGGAPGIFSARYAGENATYVENVSKLLEEMSQVTGEGRSARFRTVALIVWEDGAETIAEGVVEAVKNVGLKVPLVVRLDGTNVDRGKRIINEMVWWSSFSKV